MLMLDSKTSYSNLLSPIINSYVPPDTRGIPLRSFVLSRLQVNLLSRLFISLDEANAHLRNAPSGPSQISDFSLASSVGNHAGAHAPCIAAGMEEGGLNAERRMTRELENVENAKSSTIGTMRIQ